MANIIDSYRKLPIGKYQEILSISQDSHLEDIDKQVKVISILTDLEEDTIANLPLMEYKSLALASSFLEEVCTDIPRTIAKEYHLGEMHLIPVTNIMKITMAQYSDFQEWSKGGEANIPLMLSCFLIPKGKKYNTDYDIMDVQQAIRENLSVVDVLSLSAFFLNLLKTLMRFFLIYSKIIAVLKLKKDKRKRILAKIQEQEALLNNGDGLRMWMR